MKSFAGLPRMIIWLSWRTRTSSMILRYPLFSEGAQLQSTLAFMGELERKGHLRVTIYTYVWWRVGWTLESTWTNTNIIILIPILIHRTLKVVAMAMIGQLLWEEMICRTHIVARWKLEVEPTLPTEFTTST
jgi:hypothetical protein